MSDAVSSLTWYDLRGDEAVRALKARCAIAETANKERAARACLFGSLFEGCQLSTFNSVGYDLITSQQFKLLQTPIIRNTCRSIVLTLLAKLFCLDAPLPKAMSDAGNWAQRSKAEDVDQFLECEYGMPQGEFGNIDDLWNQAGMIAMAAVGSACVIVRPGYDQVEAELDDTLMLGVHRSGRWGSIRTVERTAWMDPEEMVFRFPRKYKADILASIEDIEDPLESTRLARGSDSSTKRMVRYYQGWRVRVNGHDGRYLLALKNGKKIQDDPYKRPQWPGVLFHWERQLAGEWGTPLTQSIIEDCIRENERLADADDMIANFAQIITMGPKSVTDQLAQAKGITRLEVDQPDLLKVTVTERLDRQGLEAAAEHSRGAHAIAGVNEAQTSASKAPGSTSGYHEELISHSFAERFADQQRRLTHAKVDATAKRFLWAAQDMIEAGAKDFTRQWKTKDGQTYRAVKVADLDLDSSRYVFTIAAVSEDKDAPRTRAKKADEYLRLQLIDGAEWLQAQRDGDVTAATKLSNKQFSWVDNQIRRWTRDPEETLAKSYRSPRKWLDPKASGRQVALAALDAEDAGCPQSRLNYFDKFLDECTVLVRQEAEQAAKVGAALPGTTDQLSIKGQQQ